VGVGNATEIERSEAVNLARWNPFHEMEDLMRSYSRALAQNPSQGMTRADWAPSVDITENDKEFLIMAELPGIKKDDIKIQLHNGVLTISGERKSEKRDEKEHRIERYYGSFARSFALPENVKEDGVTAEHVDGVLHLKLPKSEPAKPKAVEIKVR
jgi:HSP20 family protein